MMAIKNAGKSRKTTLFVARVGMAVAPVASVLSVG